MTDLPTPYSLPEYPASTWSSKTTLRLPGTGAASASTTNATVPAPVKGWSVMLRVPGLPKDTSAATMAKAAGPETPTSAPIPTTRPRAEKEEVAAVEPIPIQPTPSTSKTTMSTTISATVTQAARTISTTAPVQTTSQRVGTVPKVETAGGGQEEEEEGDVEMNEEKEADEAHEDDGDHGPESSAAKRGVKRKVAPPPPAAATPTTTTVPPVDAVFSEEVKINNTVVPLSSHFIQKWTTGRTKRKMEMERASRTGRKTRRSDGSGMWKYRWDRAFWRLVRREERCGRCMWIEISCWMGLRRSLGSCFLSLLVLRVLVFYSPPLGPSSRFALQLYMYTRLLSAVSRSLVN